MESWYGCSYECSTNAQRNHGLGRLMTDSSENHCVQKEMQQPMTGGTWADCGLGGRGFGLDSPGGWSHGAARTTASKGYND
eukprot:232983-Pelagomonas_calceolata.AAC.4